tara:strand:- start:3837 stop:4235 length:399 start_codon:yes stop_codon:yes gene_type:complete
MAKPIKKKTKTEKLDERYAKKAAKGRMYKGEQMSKKDIRRYKRADKKIDKAKGTSKEKSTQLKYGYNYEEAKKRGIKPDATGHMQSRVPETGLILKGRKHPTIYKTRKYEKAVGYKVIRKGDKLESHPKKKK